MESTNKPDATSCERYTRKQQLETDVELEGNYNKFTGMKWCKVLIAMS